MLSSMRSICPAQPFRPLQTRLAVAGCTRMALDIETPVQRSMKLSGAPSLLQHRPADQFGKGGMHALRYRGCSDLQRRLYLRGYQAGKRMFYNSDVPRCRYWDGIKVQFVQPPDVSRELNGRNPDIYSLLRKCKPYRLPLTPDGLGIGNAFCYLNGFHEMLQVCSGPFLQ